MYIHIYTHTCKYRTIISQWSFINRYLLRKYYVLGTVMDARYHSVNKTDKTDFKYIHLFIIDNYDYLIIYYSINLIT